MVIQQTDWILALGVSFFVKRGMAAAHGYDHACHWFTPMSMWSHPRSSAGTRSCGFSQYNSQWAMTSSLTASIRWTSNYTCSSTMNLTCHARQTITWWPKGDQVLGVELVAMPFGESGHHVSLHDGMFFCMNALYKKSAYILAGAKSEEESGGFIGSVQTPDSKVQFTIKCHSSTCSHVMQVQCLD